MESKESLYERLGGMDTVNSAVDIFYAKVLADESINHFFDNKNMKKQIAKQKAFLSYAFGCPMNYTGKTLRKAHKKMELNESHFEAVAGHLIYSLEELNVPGDLIDEVVTITLSVKDEVLNR
ncbi:group 1 truncated hemoglobin [Aurantibacter sp.]|uniref:group I truncated hemoglobin n=1 Tax=Aurantibacter sp. TaxID=2807103 RepID=UPI003264700D